MPFPNRTRTVALAALVTTALVAGCSGSGSTASAPTTPTADVSAPAAPSPTPTQGPTLPQVPVQSADLSTLAQAAVVPPVSLTIPAVGIEVPIDPVGVEEDGQMEIPPLAERAGWYRFGSAPGEPAGTTVIAAHVDSVASAGLGPFARLVDVEPGATVTVTSQDGSVRDYVVREVTTVPKASASWGPVFTRDGDPRLVLVTCGGTFRREVSSYTDNILVTADPVGG